MVKLIWGYVFQEVIDEHGTLDVIKTSRFGFDYIIDNILSFNDALSWYINTSEDGLKEVFELYKISLEIWNESPGRSLKRPNMNKKQVVLITRIRAYRILPPWSESVKFCNWQE